MNDTSSLVELAEFAGLTVQPDEPAKPVRKPLATLTAQLGRNPQRRTVSELLGIVLVLSARTRRAAMPRTRIDLDVFRPDGSRAVRILFDRRS